jgi:hypothetical protein
MKTRQLFLFVALAVPGCSSAAEDAESVEHAQNESRDAYDFQLPGSNAEMVRVDAMGVALLSTVLMNRDRTASGGDNHNRYQNDTPDVQNDPRTLLTFVHFLRTLHGYWREQLEDGGFEPCSKRLLGIVSASPCTLAKLRHDDGKEGPRVVDAVLPDYVTLDFDQPNRFPNGRTPWEPVSDKVFALGFLKMGGKCAGIERIAGVSEETKRRLPRDRDGVPLCTVETFADIGLQVKENDRAFSHDTFPYLARPWFYPEPSGDAPFFWPTARRLERPE